MSSTPPSESSEYLEPDGGSPAGREPGRGGGRRRTAILGVGAVAALGLVGGGVWAATALFATGDQPAQALPAGTLGYLSVDLDPSGTQSIAAIRTMNKFPAFESWADVDSKDDVVGKLVDLALSEGNCDLTYADDFKPWLGSRFAVAGVEAGQEKPSPVFVVQVKDATAAERGLDEAIATCGGDADDEVAWSFEGDWMVVAETQEIVDQVVADTAEGTLADDEDFQQWTGEAGEPGIMTGYAAPGAGAYIADELASTGLAGDPFGTDGPFPDTYSEDDPLASDEGRFSQSGLTGGEEVPDAMVEALESFEGAAMTMRFDDGSLEIETAADTAGFGLAGLTGSEDGAAALSGLPADTVAAMGIGFEQGWGEELIGYLRTQLGEQQAAQIDQAIAQAEQETGLSIPEDLETLLGDSMSISVGAEISVEGLTASEDGSDLPIGVRIEGDAKEIEAVLEDVRRAAGPGAGLILASESDDDTVAISPSSAYRGSIGQDDGGLGDSDKFSGVVEEADRASAVLYVDVDGLDQVISQALAGGSGEIGQNIEPLSAMGLSSWTDGEVNHGLLKITTDD